MANIKIEVKEEAVNNVTVKLEKEEAWMPESKRHTDCEAGISTSCSPYSSRSCIGLKKESPYSKRKVIKNNRVEEGNDGDMNDCYSYEISESDDRPLLKNRKPQNGFMQGYWPDPNEIDFEEFAKEIAEDCIDDIPLVVPTDLPKVPGTKYVDLVVSHIPSFDCSLDSSDDEKYSMKYTPQIETKKRGRKKEKSCIVKNEKIQDSVVDMKATKKPKVSLKLKKEVDAANF